jgi:hypothetical protein
MEWLGNVARNMHSSQLERRRRRGRGRAQDRTARRRQTCPRTRGRRQASGWNLQRETHWQGTPAGSVTPLLRIHFLPLSLLALHRQETILETESLRGCPFSSSSSVGWALPFCVDLERRFGYSMELAVMNERFSLFLSRKQV